MSADLQILQLVRELPLPSRTGSHIRAVGIAAILSEFGTVDVVGRASRFGASEVEGGAHYRSIKAVDASHHPAKLASAVRTAPLSPRHFRAAARALDRVDTRRVYDLAIVEELYAAVPEVIAALAATGARVIYSAHNVEGELAIPYRAIPKRLSARLLEMDKRSVAAFEAQTLSRCHGAICVSAADRSALLAAVGSTWQRERIVVIPNCPRPRGHPLPQWSDRRGVILAGSLRWSPNQEGLRWFIAHVAPILRRAAPELPITVVTNAISRRDLRALRDLGVAVHVNVEDADRFHREARVAVVPLFTGGGSRVRIVEGLSAGLRVVTTSKGAEGQPAEVSNLLDIVDTPTEFAERILRAAAAPAPPAGRQPPEWLAYCETMSNLLRTMGLLAAPPADSSWRA